ncbi:hypothetical protein Rleg5DRAFT_5333 [Rhizobium leguminosarum bv. viciae WSM1455]|nr:hypothetical protein Rleg5DRAFT_5333 [Rhizobium leguminosarum bv. viciae WSM1455]
MGQSTIDVLTDIYSIVRGSSDLWRIHVHHIHDPSGAADSLSDIGETVLGVSDIFSGWRTVIEISRDVGAFSSGGSSGKPFDPTVIYGYVGGSATRMASDGWRFI